MFKKYPLSIYIITVSIIFGLYFMALRKEFKEELLGGKTIATSTIDNYINSLTASQTTWILSHPKYFSTEKTYLPQYELTYWVDEYEAPGNKLGYQITILRDNGYMKSVGVGADLPFKTYDWTLPVSTTASTTP